MVSLCKQTYFVTSHHDMAKPMIGLLTERLTDEGWRVTLSTTTTTNVYCKAGRRHMLSTVCVQSNGGSSMAYMSQDKYCTVTKYLTSEQALSKAQATLVQTVLTHEHKYMLEGSPQRISFLAADSGVYLSADCTLKTHAMLSEYYALSNDPDVLYSATDENGDLWEISSGEGGEGYDD